jgi:hypothetical protein
MSVSKLSKEQFGQFVDAMLAAGRKVVGVVAKDDRFQFDELKSAAELRLDYDVTILPPKKYVLPQVEPLLQFEVGGPAQSVMHYDPMILLGVHPYDLIAIRQMDELSARASTTSITWTAANRLQLSPAMWRGPAKTYLPRRWKPRLSPTAMTS